MTMRSDYDESRDRCRRPALAMAYVRMQELERIYTPERALCAGTLFPELEKPFRGRRVRGGEGCA